MLLVTLIISENSKKMFQKRENSIVCRAIMDEKWKIYVVNNEPGILETCHRNKRRLDPGP